MKIWHGRFDISYDKLIWGNLGKSFLE